MYKLYRLTRRFADEPLNNTDETMTLEDVTKNFTPEKEDCTGKTCETCSWHQARYGDRHQLTDEEIETEIDALCARNPYM